MADRTRIERKVVAFLQNMWVRDAERARDMIERGGEECRERLIRMSLFAGCLTGRRLKQTFGPAFCDLMHWEESTREIAADPKTVFPPDEVHIADVLDRCNPLVVIAFGQIAGDAVGKIWSGPLVRAPHPAARQKDTIARLIAAASELHMKMIEADHG